MSYSAIVTEINTRPHSNADRVQLGTVLGQQVVIGLDVKDGDLGVYFPTDGQLSNDFCVANDLYPVLDKDGRRVGGGFIDRKNRRVKAQSFRGERSDGFWLPISCLDFIPDRPPLGVGMGFTEINGVHICNKYETPATKAAKAQGASKPRKGATFTMKKHHDTDQFWRNSHVVKFGDRVIITEKLHGTSHRVGNGYDVVNLPGWRGRIVQWLAKAPILRLTGIAHGSRNVILEDGSEGYHGSDSFRRNSTRHFVDHLMVGETVYGEIVGYDANGKPLMKNRKGEAYHYGQAPGTCKFYAYRITHTMPNGHVYDLTFNQMVTRCQELNIAVVPFVLSMDCIDSRYLTREGGEWMLNELLPNYVDGDTSLGGEHIREGVCVRIERGGFYLTTLKQKSHQFMVDEGHVKDAGEVDTEEAA